MINFKLFATGLLQVIFVALNTFQIASFVKHQSILALLGILIVGFIISLIWSFNVKKVAFGTLKDRISYALGAGVGSMLGVIAGVLIY